MVTIKAAITPQKAESGARRNRARMPRPIAPRIVGGAGGAALTVVRHRSRILGSRKAMVRSTRIFSITNTTE